MPFHIYTGRAGSGKSLSMAEQLVFVLKRNYKFFKRTQVIRPIYSNLRINQDIIDHYKIIYDTPEQGEFLKYYIDSDELLDIKNADVFIDEIGTYFDAQEYKNMSPQLKRWIQQHRKRGVEIWATAQDFAQLDKSFRRLTDTVYYNVKLIGSRDVSATKPPPKYIWGISLVRHLDPTVYDEQKSKFAANGFPSFMFITREGTEVFNTRAEVRLSNALPLKHIMKECENVDCSFKKTVHV